MIGNPGPWILICVAVVAVLWWKGYLKIPNFNGAAGTATMPVLAKQTHGLPWAKDLNLDEYPVDVLSSALARAARKEAEAEYAQRMADETAKLIREKFSGPFSEPASTGSAPPS